MMAASMRRSPASENSAPRPSAKATTAALPRHENSQNSGFGRYHGDEGILGFTHTKAIMVDRGLMKSEPFWFPYEGKYDVLREAFDGLASRNLPKALWGFVGMLRKSK